MTNKTFEAAKSLHQAFQANGVAASDIDFSTNRHGQHSAYFETKYGRIRVSDHACNGNFRVNEIDMPTDFTDANAEVAGFIARSEAAAAKRREEKAAEIAARDEREAPFKARFLAAKNHEQTGIIIECYRGMAGDKARRREVADRWFGK